MPISPGPKNRCKRGISRPNKWRRVCMRNHRCRTIKPRIRQVGKRMRAPVWIVLVPMMLAAVATAKAQQSNIRQIDFKNFTYEWSDATDEGVPESWQWIASLPRTRITTVNGLHYFDEDRSEDESSSSPVLSVD